MGIDDLFTANESGRSSSILAEDILVERPRFESFYDWRDYNIRSLNFSMMVSFLMPKGMTIRHIADTIDGLMQWTNRFYDSYTVRYSNEFGVQRIDDKTEDGVLYLTRFIDFNNDPMNYVKFVFWMTHFHYVMNIKNYEYTKRYMFKNFKMIFSTKEREFFSGAQVYYSNEILPDYVYEAVLIHSIVDDVIKNRYLDEMHFRKIDNTRLLHWVDRMRMRFGIKRESHANAIYSLIKNNK